MFRRLLRAIVPLALLMAGNQARAAIAVAPPKQVFVTLTHDFTVFFDQTGAMPMADRIVAFRKKFNTLFPGFYEPRPGGVPGSYDRSVAAAFTRFPELRPKYEAVERSFPASYAAGIAHFRTVFPAFQQYMPVYLLHSLGEMDGGVRTIRGKPSFIFGADVIAQIHDATTIGPFLDHEFFHIENSSYFTGCEAVWCSLWAEGMATYAASVLNPGANDHQLLLDLPFPIRPMVDDDWKGALCLAWAKRDSVLSIDQSLFFNGSPLARRFPARFGYYMGFRIAQRLGKTNTLPKLAHMTNAEAHVAIVAELQTMTREQGGCGE